MKLRNYKVNYDIGIQSNLIYKLKNLLCIRIIFMYF